MRSIKAMYIFGLGLWLCLALPARSFAAISYVSSDGACVPGSSPTVVSTTAGVTIQTGDILVVAWHSTYNGTVAVTSMTDSAGNVFTRQVGYTGAKQDSLEIWTAVAAANFSGDKMTVNYSPGTVSCVSVSVYRGAYCVLQNSMSLPTNSANPTITMNNVAPHDWVVGAFTGNAGSSNVPTAGTGNLRIAGVAGSVYGTNYAQTDIANGASTGTLTTSITLPSTQWLAAAIELSSSPCSPPTPSPVCPIAFVGADKGAVTSGTSVQTGTGINVNASDLIVAQFSAGDNTGVTVSTVTDSAGNVFTRQTGSSGGSQNTVEIWTAFANASFTADKVTINFSSSTVGAVLVSVYRNVLSIGQKSSTVETTSTNPSIILNNVAPWDWVVGSFTNALRNSPGAGFGTLATNWGASNPKNTNASMVYNSNQGGYNASVITSISESSSPWEAAAIELVSGFCPGSPTDTPTSTRTATKTWTPTATATFTRTSTATPTVTPSATPTMTPTRTWTPTASPTASSTASPTATPTRTMTPTATPTFSATLTSTQTITFTASPTATPSATPTQTFTQSATSSATPTVTPTMTATLTSTQTITFTASPTETPTKTVTDTDTPTVSFTATPTDSPTQTVTDTDTPTVTPTATPTVTPTITDSPGFTATSSPTPTATATATPTASPSPTVTLTASPTATPTATPTVTLTATGTITFSPSPTQSVTFTPSPTPSATASVTATGTTTPTKTVTATATLSFTVSPTFTPLAGFIAQVKVFNSAGEEVALLYNALGVYTRPTGLSVIQGAFLPDNAGVGKLSLDGTGVSLSWNGTNSSGAIVDSGVYYISVQVTDQFGKVDTWTSPLSVIRTDSSVLVEVYNSAGELVWSQKKAMASTETVGLSLDSRELLPSAGSNGLKISFGSGAGDFTYWKGLNAQGQAVASGVYIVEVTQESTSGAKKVFTESVTVIQMNASVFDVIVASANPVQPGMSQVTFVLNGASPGTQALGAVYSLAGERVGDLAGGTSLTWNIPQSLATGIYLVRIEASNNLGHKRAVLVKIALLR